MKLNLLLLVSILFVFSNCRKDGKACWQGFDPTGYDAVLVCDKTKTEAEAAFPQYWFYKQGEKILLEGANRK